MRWGSENEHALYTQNIISKSNNLMAISELTFPRRMQLSPKLSLKYLRSISDEQRVRKMFGLAKVGQRHSASKPLFVAANHYSAYARREETKNDKKNDKNFKKS